ncbi:hypothetical protein Pmar_PMAR010651 [Perkinsus marinus ATCC 50983]|uniref:Uncharacterized protein n=1 Tax=Perkinsus marinus (strain ATCC 50983 / TXsc) TaxID=423536 RepID=C5L4P1_PERM5|nr:hypothetical protein Pmar_PMAR010651 [Perkinsus marinus ATCC 50983]EER08309.1 hypothetical protein Pmar_PMAR010651 [Perkinsus marinus ATCC 50983]|mmetsp:Transcript_20680/g.20424  ORF Transcript_20680/g.20424 Transcript_20680/m.20424 type:complete len:99 (+) Transcript_20680:38-334(+)|eukprot:XP_002776493.1 hypothetical protein Pmar_PMAR010651 [Perkinsus marinus ATCC 50983]
MALSTEASGVSTDPVQDGAEEGLAVMKSHCMIECHVEKEAVEKIINNGEFNDIMSTTGTLMTRQELAAKWKCSVMISGTVAGVQAAHILLLKATNATS